MVGRKNAEKEVRWREILQRYADSGVSVREFCTSEGISEPSFYAWRKKLNQEQDRNPQAMVPVSIDESGPSPSGEPLLR